MKALHILASTLSATPAFAERVAQDSYRADEEHFQIRLSNKEVEPETSGHTANKILKLHMLFHHIKKTCTTSVLVASLLIATTAAAQTIDEVPFITSPDNVTLEMLNAAGVKRGDHVIDLGSGDGRIVILAAKRFEATGLGVEIDPRLVEISKTNARSAGVADKVEFREQDLFKTNLAAATVVTMYLLPEVNLRLRSSLLALKPGTRVVSHDWDMGDWQPDRTTVIPVPDKVVGLEKSSKVHLWTVPARVDGLWCAAGLLRGASIALTQKYQTFEGVLAWRDRTRDLVGTINGTQLRVPAGRNGELILQAVDNTLRISAAQGDLALVQGQSFLRATGASCS